MNNWHGALVATLLTVFGVGCGGSVRSGTSEQSPSGSGGGAGGGAAGSASGGGSNALACLPSHHAEGGVCVVNEVSFQGGSFTMGEGDCLSGMDLPKDSMTVWPDCPLSDKPHTVTVKPFAIDAALVLAVDVAGTVDAAQCPTRETTCLTATQLAPFVLYTAYGSDVVHAADAICSAFGKRLVTEAEWEFAATAGGSREYPWGDADPTCDVSPLPSGCPGKSMVPDDGSGGARFTASQFAPTPEGIFDFSGPVAEVVAPSPDAYDPDYEALPLFGPRWPIAVPESCDPDAPSGQPYGEQCARVDGTRGGWFGGPDVLRRARRRYVVAQKPHAVVGLRCARDL